jgi:predicted enzyme related to lactoylglutathione lyase
MRRPTNVGALTEWGNTLHSGTCNWGCETTIEFQERLHANSIRHDLTLQEKKMANPFVHVELNTTDVSKAKTFYGALFNWTLEDVPMAGGSYTIIKVGEGTGGGLMKHPVPGAPSAWLAYVLVDDIAAATKKAKSLGATVMKDVTEVMGMGSLSILIDPTGAALGLWQPNKK